MEPKYYSGIYETSFQQFLKHFDNEDNEKIIFSARYGMGKTTFLNEFFNSEYQKQWKNQYQVFKIFPVNYSISNNDDIIQYIKYDLIFEILRTNKDLDKTYSEIIKDLPQFVLKNLDKVAASLIYMIPKIGKDVVEAYERIGKLKDEFLKESESTGEKMVDYLEKIQNQQGGLYEYDVLTKLISDTPPVPPNSKKVLIVDDIDRLDPEHVFRILNVFAAHFDASQDGRGNKFKFDKVIIVCDFDNVKNIFQHRYGMEVDFMGYIDKFYSSEIFKFDNQYAISNTVEAILNEVVPVVNHPDSMNFIKQRYTHDSFVQNIIIILLRLKKLSFRNLLKIRGKKIDFHYDKIYFDRDYNIGAHVIRIAYQVKLLVDIVGDVDHFLDAAKECKERGEVVKNYETFIGELFLAMSVDSHKMVLRQGMDFLFDKELFNIRFDPGVDGLQIKTYESKGIFSKEQFKPSVDQFWHALINTCITFKRTGYLK